MIAKIKKIIKTNLILGLLLLIPTLAGFNLLKPGYFSMHDDVQIMRLYEMEQCLKDGQIPCRWVPDMGAGYGHPLFNYHPVFPYYVGMFFRLFNLSFLNTGKLLFFFSLLLSGLSMYLLGKEFFGKTGGLVSSVLYVLAPYRAVDIYVRGALTEAYAFVFFPLIFLFLYKYLKTQRLLDFVLSILSLAGLFLTHNLMPLIFTPIAFIWGLYWIFNFRKPISNTLNYLLIFVWAVGLSAFFILPSVMEMNLARLDLMTINNFIYKDHFVSLSQLFINRNWGYGSSVLGFNDDLSFQIGWPHWILGLINICLYGYLLFKKKKYENYPLILIIFFLLSVFMSLSISVEAWNLVPFIKYIQFPWRFLAVMVFITSLWGGWIFKFLEAKKHPILLAFSLIILTFVLNISYFKPQNIDSKMTDAVKLSGWERERQSTTTLLDYVPKTVKLLPIYMAPKDPIVINGQASVSNFQKRSDFWRVTVDNFGNNDAVVEIPIFEFPTWEVVVDSKMIEHSYNPDTGVIRFSVSSGKHEVSGWFRNTLVRKIANGITLISFVILIFVIIIKGRKK